MTRSASKPEESGGTLQTELLQAVDGNRKAITSPGQISYRAANVGCNLEISLRPIAIAFPRTTAQIQALVKVGAEHGLRVCPRSGGHSYGNHSLGGVDGALVIDLQFFQYVTMDHETWIASVGGGTRLQEVTKQLYANGKRAIPHGTCPTVGIGGHATVGGIGPMSRLWGTTLDHIIEMTVVLADSRVVTVNRKQHPDLFYAIRGAGASFAIVIEFKFQTRPAPDEAVHFSHNLSGSYTSMTESIKDWQLLVQDPSLTRKIFTQVIVTTLGMNITGTYFGSEEDFRQEPFAQRFVYMKPVRPALKRNRSSGSLRRIFQNSKETPASNEPRVKIDVRVYKNNWLGLIREWAGGWLLSKILGRPSHFYAKSLTVTEGQELSASSLEDLFAYLDTVKKGTPIWFIILDMAGGCIKDVPSTDSAFALRNASFFCQAYSISLGKLTNLSKAFIDGIHGIFQSGFEGGETCNIYPGYVDPDLRCGQARYWGEENLKRLQAIKSDYDPMNMFGSPQGVRPARPAGS